MTSCVDCALIGKWRIVWADLWNRDYLDLVEPAYITFHDSGHGEFAFGAVNGGQDCEYSPPYHLLYVARLRRNGRGQRR